MAATCFGPPPLPPNKKSLLNSNGHHRHRKHHHAALSSTYLSFRDPAEDEITVLPTATTTNNNNNSTNDLELKSLNYKLGGLTLGAQNDQRKCNKKVCHTNSLKRVKTGVKLSLVRSHSEGNLNKKSSGFTPVTFNKCMRVLSGSWKNLLQCKFNILSMYISMIANNYMLLITRRSPCDTNHPALINCLICSFIH